MTARLQSQRQMTAGGDEPRRIVFPMTGVSLQVKAYGRGLVMSTGGWLARWKGGCETSTQERE